MEDDLRLYGREGYHAFLENGAGACCKKKKERKKRGTFLLASLSSGIFFFTPLAELRFLSTFSRLFDL